MLFWFNDEFFVLLPLRYWVSTYSWPYTASVAHIVRASSSSSWCRNCDYNNYPAPLPVTTHCWRVISALHPMTPTKDFLVATKRHYMCVHPSVRRLVRNAFAFWPTRSDLCCVYGLVFVSNRSSFSSSSNEMYQWINVWINDRLNEWINEWMIIEWNGEWLNKWMK